MATSSEKRALIFLAAIAALGVGVRALRSGRAAPSDTTADIDRQIASVDSAVASRGRRPGARDRARSKNRRGSADSVETSDLREDPAPRSARPREPGSPDLVAARQREVAESNRAAQQRLDDLSEVIRITPKTTSVAAGAPRTRQSTSQVDLDTADEATISTVPWIGESLAAKIVFDRTQRGSFGSLKGLQRVAGIGPGLSSRIASHVRFSGSGMGPPTVIRFRKSRP